MGGEVWRCLLLLEGAVGDSDLQAELRRLMNTTQGGPYQAVGVIAHVPQRNQRQGHPGTILRGNLVLSSHNGRDRPPVTIRKEANYGRHI